MENNNDSSQQTVDGETQNQVKALFTGAHGYYPLLIAICVIFYGIELILCFCTPNNAGAAIVGTIGIPFTVLGWKTINAFQPTMFLILPIIGVLIFYVVKFFLAFFVGLVVGPKWCAEKIAQAICNKSKE